MFSLTNFTIISVPFDSLRFEWNFCSLVSHFLCHHSDSLHLIRCSLLFFIFMCVTLFSRNSREISRHGRRKSHVSITPKWVDWHNNHKNLLTHGKKKRECKNSKRLTQISDADDLATVWALSRLFFFIRFYFFVHQTNVKNSYEFSLSLQPIFFFCVLFHCALVSSSEHWWWASERDTIIHNSGATIKYKVHFHTNVLFIFKMLCEMFFPTSS